MEEALDKIGQKLPSVVLSDIGLPGMDGIAGVRILKERYPDLLILMLSVYDDDVNASSTRCVRARPVIC